MALWLLFKNETARPKWVLEVDIEGFFDNINHSWMLQNIPMDKQMLKEFLKGGFAERNH